MTEPRLYIYFLPDGCRLSHLRGAADSLPLARPEPASPPKLEVTQLRDFPRRHSRVSPLTYSPCLARRPQWSLVGYGHFVSELFADLTSYSSRQDLSPACWFYSIFQIKTRKKSDWRSCIGTSILLSRRPDRESWLCGALNTGHMEVCRRRESEVFERHIRPKSARPITRRVNSIPCTEMDSVLKDAV